MSIDVASLVIIRPLRETPSIGNNIHREENSIHKRRLYFMLTKTGLAGRGILRPAKPSWIVHAHSAMTAPCKCLY